MHFAEARTVLIICLMYGSDAIAKRPKFVEDASRSGRSSEGTFKRTWPINSTEIGRKGALQMYGWCFVLNLLGSHTNMKFCYLKLYKFSKGLRLNAAFQHLARWHIVTTTDFCTRLLSAIENGLCTLAWSRIRNGWPLGISIQKKIRFTFRGIVKAWFTVHCFHGIRRLVDTFTRLNCSWEKTQQKGQATLLYENMKPRVADVLKAVFEYEVLLHMLRTLHWQISFFFLLTG